MRWQTGCSAGAILLLWFAMCIDGAGAEPWLCRAQPVEACFKHHGRLSSQNGISLKIWLIGTRRLVALDNDVDDLPAILRKFLDVASPDHSYVYGDFDICPLEPDTPGHIRRVCVVGAEKLAVHNPQSSLPPIRLLSTWPSNQVREKNGTQKKP